MSTELRVTLPGPEGSADARRSLRVLDRFLTLLGRLEDATLHRRGPHEHTAWGFTDVRLGSLVTTLAPNRLADGATSVTLKEVAGVAMSGLEVAEQQEGLPPGWDLRAADAGVELAQLLGLLVTDGIVVEWLQDGLLTRSVTVTRKAAENLGSALKVRRQSIGSVIGRLDTVSLHQRREAGLWHERTGERVTVFFDKDHTTQIQAALGRRVEVAGRIARNMDDKLISIRMRSLELLPEDAAAAPATDLIGLDPDLTRGASPGDYLREIRGAS
ncbi:hypothetical protein AB0F73_17920 [Micromonospora purpureochromogenes]|uniref:hypothetical protein n=1 Tax=Micromonospora purpureochromogenes TaxID=47872 RepID=UPI0033C0B465